MVIIFAVVAPGLSSTSSGDWAAAAALQRFTKRAPMYPQGSLGESTGRPGDPIRPLPMGSPRPHAARSSAQRPPLATKIPPPAPARSGRPSSCASDRGVNELGLRTRASKQASKATKKKAAFNYFQDAARECRATDGIHADPQHISTCNSTCNRGCSNGLETKCLRNCSVCCVRWGGLSPFLSL